ncbi:hypothetical protein BDY21DRAFT_38996 [Lineolata rhizophorae]|uniref:Uncharacterized protein n=1 Tax=Lineolata rhizophorae TaxID=578093 RepID=A0A6A6P0A2_9PEZI|nr:hypothetical protein BDY21DRAFT_38996 [Lineolata rhizophorae]
MATAIILPMAATSRGRTPQEAHSLARFAWHGRRVSPPHAQFERRDACATAKYLPATTTAAAAAAACVRPCTASREPREPPSLPTAGTTPRNPQIRPHPAFRASLFARWPRRSSPSTPHLPHPFFLFPCGEVVARRLGTSEPVRTAKTRSCEGLPHSGLRRQNQEGAFALPSPEDRRAVVDTSRFRTLEARREHIWAGEPRY